MPTMREILEKMQQEQARFTPEYVERERARYNAIGGAAMEAAERVKRQFQAEDERGSGQNSALESGFPSEGRGWL
jgi:hypothetical protein